MDALPQSLLALPLLVLAVNKVPLKQHPVRDHVLVALRVLPYFLSYASFKHITLTIIQWHSTALQYILVVLHNGSPVGEVGFMHMRWVLLLQVPEPHFVVVEDEKDIRGLQLHKLVEGYVYLLEDRGEQSVGNV